MPRSYRHIPMYGYGAMQKAGGAGAPSGWTPASLTAIHSWFRADTEVTGTTTVTAWGDKSGNGHDLSSVDGTPSLSASEASINGHPAIEFTSGTAENLHSESFPTETVTNHVFAVFNCGGHANAEYIFHGGASGSSTHRLAQVTPSPNIQMNNGAGIIITSIPADGTFVWFEGKFATTGQSAYRVNDTDTTGLNTGTGAISVIGLGAVTAAVKSAEFKIAEYILCDAEVTGGELTSLRSYINSRYGITTS